MLERQIIIISSIIDTQTVMSYTFRIKQKILNQLMNIKYLNNNFNNIFQIKQSFFNQRIINQHQNTHHYHCCYVFIDDFGNENI